MPDNYEILDANTGELLTVVSFPVTEEEKEKLPVHEALSQIANIATGRAQRSKKNDFRVAILPHMPDAHHGLEQD